MPEEFKRIQKKSEEMENNQNPLLFPDYLKENFIMNSYDEKIQNAAYNIKFRHVSTVLFLNYQGKKCP